MKTLTKEEMKVMRKSGRVAAYILKKLGRMIKPGISTRDIEVYFDHNLERYPEMDAAFKGFNGYPASLCVSVNEEVIHGIPSDRKIKEGDMVSVDLGIEYKGLFVDTACTYLIGKTSLLQKQLRKVTFLALFEGIKKAKVGATIGDIGYTIQNFVENYGFSVIRKFVGHGIGRDLHLSPEVPNFGKQGEGEELREGMVLAIEPMVSAGNFEVEVLADGWTAKTKDNALTAHFEHTVAITNRGPKILTQ